MTPANRIITLRNFLGPITLAIAVILSFMLSNDNYGELILLTIIVFITTLFVLYRDRLAISSVHITIYLFLFYIAINPFWSINTYRSMFHILVLCQIPLLFLTFSTDRIQKSWGNYLLLLAIPALVSSLWGIIEYIQTDQRLFTFLHHRVDGFLVDPNSFAAMQYVFSILLFSLSFIHPPQNALMRWSIWFIQFLIITSLFLTLSRSGIAIWLLCILGILTFLFTKNIIKIRNLKKYLISLFFIVLFSYTFIQFLATQIDQPIAREDLPNGLLSTTLNGRFEIWEPTFRLIAERPLLGWGLNTFQSLYPSIRNEYYSWGGVAHNDYIQFALEGGITLLLFLLIYLGFHLYIFFKLFTRKICKNDQKSGVELALMLLLNLALLFHSITNFSFYIIQFCILSGIVFARSYYLSVNLELIRQPDFIRIPGKSKRIFTLVLAIIMTPMLYKSISGFLFVNSERYALTKSLSTNINLLNIFTAISPHDLPSSSKLAAILHSRLSTITDENKKKKIVDYVISILQSLTKEYPYNATNYYNLGNAFLLAYLRVPEHQENYKHYADLWIQSIEVDPTYVPPYIKLYNDLTHKREYQQALSLLEGLVPWFNSGKISGKHILQITGLLAILAEETADELLPLYKQLSLSAEQGNRKVYYATINEINQRLRNREMAPTTIRSSPPLSQLLSPLPSGEG